MITSRSSLAFTLLATVATIVMGGSAFAAPPLDEIIGDAVNAMGGKEKIEKIETLRTKGSMLAMGQKMTMESYWARSGARRVDRSMAGMPAMVMGFDGKVGWMTNPMGGSAMPLTKDQIEQLDEQTSLHMNMLTMKDTLARKFGTIELVGESFFGGQMCHKLHVVGKDDAADAGHFYIGVESKLPVGSEMMTDAGRGPTMAAMTLSDWKEIDGVKFFGKVSVAGLMDLPMEMVFSELEINKTPKSVFEAPPGLAAPAGIPGAPGSAPRSAPGATTAPAQGSSGKRLEDFPPDEQARIKQMLEGFNRINDPAQLEQMAKSLEAGLAFLPADRRESITWVLEQVRERIKQLKG